jgi:hypothetical protein
MLHVSSSLVLRSSQMPERVGAGKLSIIPDVMSCISSIVRLSVLVLRIRLGRGEF